MPQSSGCFWTLITCKKGGPAPLFSPTSAGGFYDLLRYVGQPDMSRSAWIVFVFISGVGSSINLNYGCLNLFPSIYFQRTVCLSRFSKQIVRLSSEFGQSISIWVAVNLKLVLAADFFFVFLPFSTTDHRKNLHFFPVASLCTAPRIWVLKRSMKRRTKKTRKRRKKNVERREKYYLTHLNSFDLYCFVLFSLMKVVLLKVWCMFFSLLL